MTKTLVGQGLQCRVYRISKKRVRKIPTTHAQKIKILLSWKLGQNMTKKGRERFARTSAKQLASSLRGIRGIVAYMDAPLLGNPVFLPAMRYEQDFMQPLGHYLKSHALKENKKAIKSYIDLIIIFWQYGFADTIFNFAINNGVVKGRVVQLDLGELTFSKNKIKAQIRKKYWLRKESYRDLQDPKLKIYFKKEMGKRVTLKALKENWRTKLPH